MTQITTTEPKEITKWENIFQWGLEQAEIDLGYCVPIDRLMLDPSELSDDERENVKTFETLVYDFALMEWKKRLEQCRQVIGLITERKARRALRWLEVENYQQVEQATRAIIQPDKETSTGRQIESFITNHMPALDQAQVDPQQTMEIVAREDSIVLSTSRAISRVVKDESISKEKRNELIREIADDAVSAKHAGIIREKWLGSDVKLARDIFHMEDGTVLITFICEDEHDFIELCQHTDRITAQHGNTMPILLETRDERTWEYALTQLRIALAIIESGDNSALHTADTKIVQVLNEYGYIS